MEIGEFSSRISSALFLFRVSSAKSVKDQLEMPVLLADFVLTPFSLR
jgi:hypothetical protein